MMKWTMWQLVKPAAALIMVCIVAFAVCYRSQPREYRGVLKYPVIAVGFETTGVALVAPEGTYELAMPRGVRWRDHLHAINDRSVVVTGRLTTRKGKWRPERRIIRVEDLVLEPQGGG